jgi:LysR family glycine cleavage system transcriptional activator
MQRPSDLPQLAFLPTFEAAGRLGSFKAAAEELRVTPSAVSQQIKTLEETLGSLLFERRGRAIVLTRVGASYLEEVQQALAAIASASRRLRRRTDVRALRLSVPDFIAYEFLLPRLSSFQARFPSVELNLEVSSRLAEFSTSDVDAALRVAGESWPGLKSQALGAAWVSPVCSQELAASLKSVAQLREHTLIEVRGQERNGWHAFMQKHGVATLPKMLVFEGYLEALLAAEQGLGVAFGVFPMTSNWVLNHRLAVPLPIRMSLRAKIQFVHRISDPDAPLYTKVIQWLREQYEALPALPEGRLVDVREGRSTGAARRDKAQR